MPRQCFNKDCIMCGVPLTVDNTCVEVDNPISKFTEGDKVRIITEASRDEVKAAASQLKRAGLSGAAIVAQPKSAPESFLSDPSAKPVSAARSFIDGVHGPEVSKMNPEKLHDWAKEAGLWD